MYILVAMVIFFSIMFFTRYNLRNKTARFNMTLTKFFESESSLRGSTAEVKLGFMGVSLIFSLLWPVTLIVSLIGLFVFKMLKFFFGDYK